MTALLYTLKLKARNITASRPLAGVTYVMYRLALTHVPASQIYGLTLKALVLMDERRETKYYIGDSSLNAIKKVKKALEDVLEVQPALPYVDEAQEIIESIASRLEERVSRALERAVIEAPLLKALVKVPKALARTLPVVCGRLGVKVGVEEDVMLPLAILPVIPLLATCREGCQALNNVLQHPLFKVRHVRRFRTGVAFDRLRNAAAYGMMYTYQYTSLNIHTFMTAISTRREITMDFVKYVKALNVGFKRNVFDSIEDATMLLSGKTKVRNLIFQLFNISCRALAPSEKPEKIRVLYYAYDTSVFKTSLFNGVVREVRMYPVPSIYLELFNTFYTLVDVSDNMQLKFVDAGSEVLVEYPEGVDKAIESARSILEGLKPEHIRVFRRDKPSVEARGIIKTLVLHKLNSSLVNYVPIPLPPR